MIIAAIQTELRTNGCPSFMPCLGFLCIYYYEETHPSCCPFHVILFVFIKAISDHACVYVYEQQPLQGCSVICMSQSLILLHLYS